MSDKRKIEKLNRDEKARRDAVLKEHMKHPINQFMCKKDEKGKVKYSMASRLQDYFLVNPDPILNAMRMSNALLHEIRWHKEQASKYFAAAKSETIVAKMYDKDGQQMNRNECYIVSISETQTIQIALSKLRNHLIQNLLITVDDDIFTFEQFNDYLIKTEKIIAELGYELFPTQVKLIEPL